MLILSRANRTHRWATESDQLVAHFVHQGNRDLADLFDSETANEIDK